jgi:hypothetical protein
MTRRLPLLLALLAACAPIDEVDPEPAPPPEGPLGLVFETTPSGGDPVQRVLPGLHDGATVLEGDELEVFTCDGDCFEDWTHLALADEQGDFLFDPVIPPSGDQDPAAEVNAWYHLQAFLARYRELGFAGFDVPILAVVDLDWGEYGLLAGATEIQGRPSVLFGRLDEVDLAYDPDVYGHELGHLVIPMPDATIVSTGLSGAVPALGEGSADYFSATIMGDPHTGEWSAGYLGLPFLNSADNDVSCPDDLTGQAHMDGRMWQGALWELRQLFGPELVDQAAWDALASLPAGATWQQVAEALRTRLGPLLQPADEGDLQAVLEGRGLLDCQPFLELSPAQQRWIEIPAGTEEVFDVELGEEIGYGRLPAALQLVVEVPDGLSEVRFVLAEDVEDEPMIDPADLVLYLRWGEPVAWSTDDGELNVVADHELPGSAPLVLTAAQLLSGSLYASISHGGDEGAFLDVFVEFE